MTFIPKIPIFAKKAVVDGKQYVKVWTDSTPKYIESPVLPYCYVNADLPDEHIPNVVSKTVDYVTPMSTRQLEVWYRLEFRNLYDLEFFYEYLISPDYDGPPVKVSKSPDNLLDLIGQETDGWWGEHSNTKPLTYMVFDIEQYTDGSGMFPKPTDTVISMAWCINDEPVEFIESDGMNDRNVIQKFIQVIRAHDPDIIVGFNHCFYDLRVMIAKLRQYGYSPDILCREQNKDRGPFMYKTKIGPRHVECMSAAGRVFYDVYHAVLTDQTLHGIKLGLKSVARHYYRTSKTFRKDCPEPPVEEDTSNTSILMGTPELEIYNKSDVTQTRGLFKMYFQNNLAAAEFIKTPLCRLVPMATSRPFKQILGQIYKEQGILPDTSNLERYPEVYVGLSDDDSVYQGAYVGCNTVGYFKDVYEYDVSSLYPSIMVGLGIAPDNTRLLKIDREYSGEFNVTETGDSRIYYVPDSERNWTWVVEVNGRSKIAEIIEQFLKQRMEMKSLYKATGDGQYYALAYGLKVILNSIYGVCGSRYGNYGEVSVGALVTAVGRMILQECERVLGPSNCILMDTDGIKTTVNLEAKHGSVVKLNQHFEEYVKQWYMKPTVNWEKEGFKSIWAIKQKNYLLLNDCEKCEGQGITNNVECNACDGHGDIMTIHGASFKASSYPKMFVKIINTVGRKLLQGANARELAVKAHDFSQYESDDFIMTTRLQKEVNEYSSKNSKQVKVAIKYQKEKGANPRAGMAFDYIAVGSKKNKPKWAIPNEQSMKQLNVPYYREIIETALERLGFGNVLQTELAAWGFSF